MSRIGDAVSAHIQAREELNKAQGRANDAERAAVKALFERPCLAGSKPRFVLVGQQGYIVRLVHAHGRDSYNSPSDYTISVEMVEAADEIDP